MNDTKATNRIKADVLRQLMEMSPEPVINDIDPLAAAMAHEIPDRWPEYETEYKDNSDYNWAEEEEAYLRDVDDRYISEREEEIERMIKASEDASNYLKAIEEFNE